VTEVTHLLEDEIAYNTMASVVNPYGDGHASERIVTTLLERSSELITMTE
jgi:UDP-N-acetylglucosamine 2-epimerase